MGLYKELDSHIHEVDVIIAGGTYWGTASCVIASRLSDAYPSLSILVIESGSNNRDVPNIVHPALFVANVYPGSTTALCHRGKRSPYTANREVIIQSGGVLGGGSSINMMTYSRAQRSDFNSWNAEGWSADAMLPYLTKLETYHGETHSQTVHGYSGPVQVSTGGFRSAVITEDFIAAADQVGLKEKVDLQGLSTNFGVQRTMRYISPDGQRQDAAHCYLHPRLEDGKHPNLHVLVESQVESIIFDGKRAVGVRYRPNPAFYNTSTDSTNKTHEIGARRMVIVSCGALGTPAVLERSGIGSASILQRAKIPIISDLPGVGQNYGDHGGMIYSYHSSLPPSETLDAVARTMANPAELIRQKEPILAWNGMDITSKVRPSEKEIGAMGLDFQEYWEENYKAFEDKPVSILTLIAGFPGNPSSVATGQYMAVTTFSSYPVSRGHSHITGPHIDDSIEFETGLLTDAQQLDIQKARWDYKLQREIMRRMNHYRGELAQTHPPFPPGSAAQCISTNGPLSGEIENIKYSEADDRIIDQWIRENISSFWHSQGTCKMALRADDGVVDTQLSVHGTKCLKVADLSVVPRIVGANTANTAFAIGEKAAEIFSQELVT